MSEWGLHVSVAEIDLKLICSSSLCRSHHCLKIEIYLGYASSFKGVKDVSI